MDRNTSIFTPVLIVGCLIVMVSFAVRASFGVFQIPIAAEFGWLRSEFSLAIAIQNLAWGIGQPIFGAIAEKIGDRRAIVAGSVVYAIGLVLSANSVSPIEHQTYAWLIGFGIAGTGFGVILAVVGRASTAENRSMSLAVATAAGSAGQVFGAPVAEWMLGFLTWQTTFVVFAGAILAMLLTLPLMRAPEMASKTELEESLGQILVKAFKDPSFTLIFLGFFSCGYQLAFLTAHFPAFVTELSSPIPVGGLLDNIGITTTSALGAVAISLIGLSNIAGTLLAGGDLHRPDSDFRNIHIAADHPAFRHIVFDRDGFTMAGYGASDQWVGRAYLWSALYGYALRDRFLQPSAWQLSGCLAWRAALRRVRRIYRCLVDRYCCWSVQRPCAFAHSRAAVDGPCDRLGRGLKICSHFFDYLRRMGIWQTVPGACDDRVFGVAIPFCQTTYGRRGNDLIISGPYC